MDFPYEKVVDFYRKAFEGQKDIKFWDRVDETYVEDHSNRPWHSVTITKLDKRSTSVVILKDNWTWAIGTLVIRFIGVFAVLSILYLALSISGTFVSRIVDAKKKPASSRG